MKHIFSYTVVHTGTRFLNNLFKKGFSNITYLGDVHVRQRGRGKQPIDYYPCKQLTAEWYKEHVSKYLTKEETESDIVRFHAHHRNVDSKILKAMQAFKPEVKVITSVRDPLLIINTLRWLRYTQKGISLEEERREDREERALYVSSLVKNILSIPKDNIFVYPVDLMGQEEEEKRIEFTKSLMSFCELDLTKETIQLTREWSFVGETKKAKAIEDQKLFNKLDQYKQAVLSYDKNKIKELFDVELAYLEKREDLKQLYSDLGYTKLGWW